jgi:hypothetical protein
MPLVYGDTSTYLTANRAELVEAAERGMGGRGALVVATFRLIDTLEGQEKATKRLNRYLLGFTIMIAVLTFVLCVFTWAQISYPSHPPFAPTITLYPYD